MKIARLHLNLPQIQKVLIRYPPLTPMTTMHFLFLNFIDAELEAKFVGKETCNTSMATKLIWAGLVLGGVLLLAFSAEKDMQWGQPSLTDELVVLLIFIVGGTTWKASQLAHEGRLSVQLARRYVIGKQPEHPTPCGAEAG
jgi:hypothetical protein